MENIFIRSGLRNHTNHGPQGIQIRELKFKDRLKNRAKNEITEQKVIFDEEVAR